MTRLSVPPAIAIAAKRSDNSTGVTGPATVRGWDENRLKPALEARDGARSRDNLTAPLFA
jgi:hypothetical protein